VVEPATVALNGTVPPVAELALDGEMVIEVTTGLDVGFEAEVTVTDAMADLVGSATLVAVTETTPAFDGAVNRPYGVMVPADALQFTFWLVVVPWTVALNWNLPEDATDVEAGLTATDKTAEELDAACPFSCTVTGLCSASVTRVTVPLTVATLGEENLTMKFWVAPGARPAGTVKPVMLKPAPVRVALVTITLVVPVLAKVIT